MQFTPVNPPRNPDECEAWLHEAIKRLNRFARNANQGFGAILRGEAPDGSGNPIVDLTKYFYKPGLPGGQIAYGGVNANDDVVFSSTKNGDKGLIVFGSARDSAYDEDADRFGIGTTEPAAKLHILGTQGEFILRPNSVIQVGGSSSTTWGSSVYGIALSFGSPPFGTDALWYQQVNNDLTDPSNTDFLFLYSFTNTKIMTVGFPEIDAGTTQWRLQFSARRNVGPNGFPTDATIQFSVRNADGKQVTTSVYNCTTDFTTGWDDYEIPLDFTGATGSTDPNEVSFVGNTGTGPFGGIPASSDFDIGYVRLVRGSGNGDTLQIWQNEAASVAVDYADDGDTGLDLAFSGDAPIRISVGSGTSGLRLLNSGTDGRIEAGDADGADMNLVLSGTREAQGELLTADFDVSYLTGTIRIAGGNPGVDKILAATDTDGNAVWKTAAELGLMMERTPVYNYAEATGIPTTTETTVLSYTAVADMIVQGFAVTGTTNMRFRLYVGVTPKAMARISVASRFENVFFGDGGLAVSAGQTVNINAYHEETATQSAACSLMGYTEA